MSATGTITMRQWAQILGVGLALTIVVVAVVAVVLPAAALAVALALLVSGAALVAQRVSTAARAARAAVAGERRAGEAPRPTLQLELADGTVISARAVPLPGDGEHTLALTRDGYVVVSAEGRVIHSLQGPARRASAPAEAVFIEL